MPGPRQPSSVEPRLSIVLAWVGLVLLAGGLVAILVGPAVPSTTSTSTTLLTTTTSTVVPPTTTIPPTTTTTTTPPTTTTTTLPTQTEYDVIVVGDGLGGATAATVAGRLGADTLLLSPIGYLGGQAGAAGVSTMDEGGNRFFFRRTGVYEELVEYMQFRYGAESTGGCYFADYSLCPEPLAVDEFFRIALANAGVDIAFAGDITDVLQDGTAVTGVIAGGVEYHAHVVIDATEFSDLYPMIEGLAYEVGDVTGCVQDTTWSAVRMWYPGGAPADLMPPEDAMQRLRDVYGTEADSWLDHFRRKVVGVSSRPEGTGPEVFPWDIDTETAYRAMADTRADVQQLPGAPQITRTGVNYANDSPLTIGAIEDPVARELEFGKALHVTYAYLWYLRWELSVTDWGVANDMQFERGTRLLRSDLIPDTLENYLPPYPYVREGRRLVATYNLGPADLADSVRDKHRFDDAVMLGGYFTDFHGCLPIEGQSGYGLFEVPIRVFIPETIDGFLPGLARAAGVSRIGSAALRTQPEEMWGGQLAGIIAGLAVFNNVEPREVEVTQVQEQLLRADLVYFLP